MSFQRVSLLIAITSLAAATYVGISWQKQLAALDEDTYGQALQEMQALDFRLTGEVMKARSGLVAHYDGLVQTMLEIKALHQTLRDMPRHLSPSQHEELARRLRAAEVADANAEAAIEHWKTDNAVLRNSLRFLPMAAMAIDAQPTDEISDGVNDKSLRQHVDTLVRDLLMLQSVEDRGLLDRIASNMSALSATHTTNADLSQALYVLMSHARIVRDRTPTVNTLTREIVRMPLPLRTASLMQAYGSYHRDATAAASARADLLFALVLITVIFGAAAIIARMRSSAMELRKTGDQLQSAVASLRVEQAKERELSELKSRFVSMTSHEFRTPLSMIMSSSELLAVYGSRWPEEKSAAHFTKIKDAVVNMTRMLDAILMIGRSDAGMLEFSPQPLDLAKLCHEAVEAAEAGLPKRCVVASELQASERVLGDESLLRHVLQNLLSNAIKYSPIEKPVYLRIRRERQDVCFEIEDCGIGISIEDQKHLFETFHRGRNVGAVAGSELGLAIVKRAVELHGGALSLDTQLGVGTKFTARVPCPGCAA